MVMQPTIRSDRRAALLRNNSGGPALDLDSLRVRVVLCVGGPTPRARRVTASVFDPASHRTGQRDGHTRIGWVN
ncbi:hypothetical protein Mycsm_00120 [Mycobacterium sp. JS623]|nr:hypothetical protein Mycsm_00120 [Mycobacterium sp. JS623]